MYSRIFIFAFFIQQFYLISQAQGQDCCKCKDAPLPSPPQPNSQQNPPCQCDINSSYCITSEQNCIDLTDDSMWINNIAAGVKKGKCFKTTDLVIEKHGGYDDLKQSFFDSNSDLMLYPSTCFKFQYISGMLNKNQLFIHMIGKSNNYQMKTKDYQCVSQNQDDFYSIAYQITYCCYKGCDKQLCLDSSESQKCLDLNQLLTLPYLDYQDQNVVKYKQQMFNYDQNYYIGQDINTNCLKRGKQQKIAFLSCFADKNNNICFDKDSSNTYCLEITDNDSGPIGKTEDNLCVFKDKYYQQIKYCYQDSEIDYKKNYCKYKDPTRTISEEKFICVNLDENQFGDKIRGADEHGNCILSEVNNQYLTCSFGYCKIQNMQYLSQCVKVSLEKDDQKQQNRISSFGFFRYCGNDDKEWAISCATGYCIPKQINRYNSFYSDQTQKKNSYYYSQTKCVKMNNQYFGKFSTNFCLNGNYPQSNIRIVECFGDYCIQSQSLKNGLQWQCVLLDSKYQNKQVKLEDFTCSSYDSQFTDKQNMNSIRCVLDFSNQTCLYKETTSLLFKCKYFKQQDASAGVTFIGRATDDGKCQQYQDPEKSIYCDNTYCLNKDSICQPFDLFFVGKDFYTKCLEERDMKNEAILCANTHCLSNQIKNQNQDSENSSSYFCEKISIDNNIIGVEKESGSCIYLGSSDQNAQNCIMGEYCLQKGPNGKNVCVPMDGDIICTDEKQNCLTKADVKNCKMCKKGQCLLVGNYDQPCQNFNFLGSSTCMAFDGTCQNFDSRNCRGCPEGTCLDLRLKACIYTNQFKLKANQCLKFKNVDVPCIYYDLDNYNNDPIIYCTDPSGRCINMKGDKAICQSCPRFYNQPGDNKCYGLKEQNDILNSGKNNAQTIFSLSINYVPINGCPQGCYKCVNSKWCTQCQDEYILYRNNDLKTQYCILVNILNGQQDTYEINFKTNQKKQIQIECDINSLYPPGRSFVYKSDYFYCYYFIIKYQEGVIRLAKLFEETIILQLNNDQNTLQALSNDKQLVSNQCLPGCITCQVKRSQHICLKCSDGFTLDFKINQCQKCPDQCISCFYGGLYNLQTINWSIDQITLQSLDISKLTEEQYRLLCEECEANKRLVLKLDFSGCELCGDNCNICSWGNQNFNLTNLFDLNQALYSKENFLKIKKCVSCIDGFIFNIDQITCVKKLQEDCLDEVFFESSVPLTKQNVIYEMKPFTTNQWFYTNPNNTYAQGCLMCNQSSSIITFQQEQNATTCTKQDQFVKNDLDNYFSYCKVPLLSTIYPNDTISTQPIKPIYQMITCLECLQNYSFDFNTNKCAILCKRQIYGCKKCFNYQSKNDILFQCTICENDQIPTQGGCQECPDGCQSCFEGDYLINFTRQLVSMRPQNSLQQKLKQLQSTDIGMICTSCTDSYYFDYNKKKCVNVKCGEFCQDCFQYKKQSKCLSCNKISIMRKISSILGYITDFYFQQILKNVDQMINYNEEYNDCFICPLSCKGCLYYKLTNNPLSLYSARCLGCNQNIQGIKIPDDFNWRYDQKNQKCLLCKKEDVGCYYEKKTEVYVTCGAKEGAIGQGIMSSPYNLQRAGEIDWDKVIVSETDFLRAVVIYNEIGLQRIDLKLNFAPSSSECQFSENVVIESTLMQQVFTLKEFVLTLQMFDATNPDQTDQRRQILLGRQIKFVGFTDINIYRIDWKLLLEDFKPTGFIFDTPYIQSVQIINSTFSNPSGLNSNFKNLFDIQIFNLQKQFTIQNTTFTNLTYQNFELIKMYQKSFYEQKNQINLQRFDQIDNLNVTLDNLYLQNNTFRGSSFMSFSSQKLFLIFENSLLVNNYLGQNSIFFLLDQKNNVGVISIWNNIMILQNVLESQFCFYVIQTFIRNEKKNIQFQENNITSIDIKPGIFQANKLWVQTLYLTKNTINNQNIFTYLPQKQTKVMYDPEYEENDKQWEPIIDKFYDYDSTLSGQEKILFQLLDIYFQNNIMSRDGPLLLEFTGETKKVGKANIREISFSCDNTLLKNQFQNIFQIKKIYQLYVDRVVICNNQNSKFLVLKEINTLNINTLDIKQEGNQNLNMRYPQVQVDNVYNYVFLRNIFMRKLLIQTCIIQIIINTENQVSLNIVNFKGLDNQLSIFDQSEEVNLISITSHSYLDIFIRSSKLENNSLTSLKKIFKYSSNGFLINSEQSKVTLKDISFNNNNALQGYSQLIIIANKVFLDSCSFVNSNFQQIKQSNILAEIQGGAFYSQSSILKISKSSFTQCFSSKGGAIYWQPRYDAVLSLNDSQFKNNIAQIENKYSEGGAIYIESGNQNQLDILLNKVYADNNLSNQNGGFLSLSYFHRKVAVLINLSQLSNNFAINGGIFNIDTTPRSQGYLILDQVQIFYDLNIFANIVQTIINNVNNIKPNEISYLSFKNLKSVEFKEVSVTSQSQSSIDKNILINKILYQPFVQFQYFTSFFAVKCIFQDIVVFQTFIEVIQARQIFIQQTKFLNIQSVKSYYLQSLQKNKNSGMTETQLKKQDDYLNIISDDNNYQQQKNSLIILDAIHIIQISQSTFEKMVCPDCYLGPLFLTSQVATLTKNNFFSNSGKNGGAINFQYSLSKLLQQFQTKNRLLFENQIVERIKTYKMRNLQLSKVFQSNLYSVREFMTLHKSRYLEEYKIIENSEIQQILIDNCQFQNNTAFNGGSIYAKNTYLKIQNSTFSNNLAEGYGGAIFNDDGQFDQIQNSISTNKQEQKDIQSNYKILYNVEILTTLILYNQAKKVGGAYYSNLRYPNMNQLTTIYRNIANQYGSDQEVSPWKMSVMYQGQQLQKNSKIILDSGYIQNELVIYLLGRRNEQFKNFTKITDEKEELEQVFLEISYISNSQNVLIQPLKIELDYGIFNLTKKLQIFGTFGTKIYLNLTCSKIKSPIYDPKTQSLISISDKYYFPITFQISDQCLPGTKVQKQDGKYDICQTCYLKTYSLEYQSQTCHKCPISDAYCYKNIILIPEGYWRKNNQSSDISECRNKIENCLGDLNATNQNLDSLKKTNSWQNNACAEGHIGAFCEDCDLKAQYWIKPYQRVNMYSCADCTQVTYNWLFVILSNAGQIVLIAIVVFSSINYIKLKIYAEYLMKMKLFYFGSSFEERNKSSLYIKILINYFQIISCLSTFRIDIPNQINFLYKTVGNPLENVLYAQDCLLIEHFMSVDLIYYRLFVSHAQIIFFIFCLFICLLIQSCITKTKMNLSIIVCAINYCLYANLPSMVNLIIGTISCIQVGDDYFVKLFTSIECDFNHEKKQKMLLWPLLCLWAVVIPLLQFLILVLKRRSLHTISMKFSFGFLYNEYSERCYWWEIVKTFQKIIIILVLNIFEQRVIVKGCIILAIVFMQMCFSLNFQPFLIPDLNKTDFISSIVCCLTISLGIILTNYNQSNGSKIIIYILVAIINLTFIIFIANKILLQLLMKAKKFLQPLIKTFQAAGDKMQQIYKRLKALRVIIEKKIIQKKYQGKLLSENHIFNKNMIFKLKGIYRQCRNRVITTEQKNELQVKQGGSQLVKKTKKKLKKNERKVRIGKLCFDQDNNKKKNKTSFLDVSQFVIKTQKQNYVPPQANQNQNQNYNLPSLQCLNQLDSVQPSILDFDNHSQFKTQKEFQESQNIILSKKSSNEKQEQKEILNTIICNRESREKSIDVKRRCILQFNITKFTQGDIQSFQRIKNLKYATYTEEQQCKAMLQQINQELDNLKSEYNSEKLVLQHISFQKQELKDFYKKLSKNKQFSSLICVLGNIQRYMNIEFNLY